MERSATDWLGRQGAAALQIVAASGHDRGQAAFERLSHTEQGQVYRLEAGGVSWIVKSFDSSREAGQQAYAREIAVLSALRGTALAPEPVGCNADHRVIVMEHVAGQTFVDILRAENAEDLCCALGRWHAAFDRRMQHAACETNWAEYLAQYPEGQIGPALGEMTGWLRGLPLREMAIARNDGFLGNYLMREGGGVIGLDYAAASLKPVGWDVLVVARQLRRDFPDLAERAVPALLEGWGRGTESLDRETFARLAVRFAEATRHLGP